MAVSWTCPECGLVYDTITPKDAAAAARSYPRRFKGVLGTAGEGDDAERLLRTRPEPATWSAVEYTAHVADALADIAGAAAAARVEDNPELTAWDPDERAAEQRYNDQPVDRVLGDLSAAADRLAGEIERYAAGDWDRTARFPWGERDALTVVRNAVHEGHHHLRDIERVLAAVRGA